MRLLPIILVLPLLTGCVAYPVIWPYSSKRSAEVSGTLLDERTRIPVSGADVFFAADPKLHSQSDKSGKFKIDATRYHYWVTWETAGGESKQEDSPLAPEIMITHTNWATRQIKWDQSQQTVLLQKLPESSAVRPWMTFDGNGTILQDGGAVRYLATRPVQTRPGFARGAIHFDPITDAVGRSNTVSKLSPPEIVLPNGTLSVLNVNFAQKVFDPHLTVLNGPNKPSIRAANATGFSWSFGPHYDGTTNLIRIEDTFYVYKLEFIR